MIGQATISELQLLKKEAEQKRAQVKQLQETLASLQAELAKLKGEPVPPVVPPAGVVPWYKRYWKHLAAGGIGAIVIIGIAIKRRKK